MLKRLFLSVLVLGLAFTVAGSSMANVDRDLVGPFDFVTGLQKGQSPHPVTVSIEAVEQLTVPLGKAAETCSDFRWRVGTSCYWWPGAFFPGVVYMTYQDPTAACVSPPYTFNVQTATFWFNSGGDPPESEGVALLYAIVFDVDNTDPACPCPGNAIWSGPTMSVNIFDAGNLVSLPLAASPYDIFCTDEPYFIGMVCVDHDPTLQLGPLLTCEIVGPQYCTWYTNVNADPADPCPWTDLAAAFEGPPGESLDLFLWSTGVTGDENDCHLPGICGWEWNHCVWNTYTFYYVAMPAPNGLREEMYSVWQAASPCTILQVDWYSSTAYPLAGDPGASISIMLDTDANNIPDLTVAYEEMATASVTPGWNSFTFPADYPVIVPTGSYYVKLGRASWAADGDTMAGTVDDHDDPSLCENNCLTFLIAADGSVMSGCDYWGASMELFVEVFQCCAQPKTCEPDIGAPDVWFTHAHDYARTGRSLMEIGPDPCNIALNWQAVTTKADSRFNNVTAFGGKVFCSDDQAIHCFDLASGALQWTYFDPAGIATAGSMRNNLTCANGYVYGSGGTAQSFFKLDTLGVVEWSRHYNSMGGGIADWMGSTLRFSVSVVAGGKVFVGTEGGDLFCLDDATGLNDVSWGTNPIDLGATIFHSPTWDGGDNLYVATLAGEVYQISIASGIATLIYTETDGDGYHSGVAYDASEDVLYLASHDGVGGGDTPERAKIGTDGTEIWAFGQGNSLYGGGSIGGKKVYFPQDYPATGLLIVDKETGLAEYDFAINGVSNVSNPATLTSDCYLFAGDRAGGWHLLNSKTMTRIWSRYFLDFVWGTALIHHDVEDKDYAVMSIWSDYTTGYINGGVFCWELNAAPRPMLEQLATVIDIPVPFGTGTGVPEAASDLFMNIGGCADLNVGPINVYDNDPPSVADLKARITKGDAKSARMAAETADKLAGDNYLSFFDDQGNLTKSGMAAGIAKDDNIETFGRALNKRAFEQGKNRTSNLAAGAQTVRTSNVALDVATPIPGGTTFGITWDYDGSGLARAVSSDILEFVNDDPDFYPELVGLGYYPTVEINYVGGCLFEYFEFMWFNGYEVWHTETVHNAEIFADGTVGFIDWGDGSNYGTGAPMFDGAQFFCDTDEEVFQWTTQHGGTGNSDAVRYLPNPAPMSGVCGIDYADYIPMGQSVVVDWNQGGGCPPVLGVDYIPVDGEVSWVQYIDTISGDPIDFTYGTQWTRVEIAAYDYGSGYGDFKLMHFKVENRDDVAKDNLIFGIFSDWDVLAYNSNAGVLDGDAGGYAEWDSSQAEVAFGWIAVGATPSLANSGEVDATGAYKYLEVAYDNYRVYTGGPGFGAFDTEAHACAFVDTSYGTFYTPGEPTNNPGDRCGIIIMPRFELDPLGSHDIYVAFIGVDATSNDHATIQGEIRGMAYRVNKWAGFCRGDVNDDNEVNAIDVAYLDAVVKGAGYPIFPYDDNGDVDGIGGTDDNDVTYLLDYLMGGAAPIGSWRFTFMP